jgi:hypothetical protein
VVNQIEAGMVGVSREDRKTIEGKLRKKNLNQKYGDLADQFEMTLMHVFKLGLRIQFARLQQVNINSEPISLLKIRSSNK